MITVKEVVDTLDKEKYNKLYELEYVLDVHTGHRLIQSDTGKKKSLTHADILQPIAYSDSKEELEEYAIKNNIVHFEINRNPCKKEKIYI